MSTVETTQSAVHELFQGFERRRIETKGATINVLLGGSGPPVLLLHGYPQTHIMWRKVAPELARDFTVVLTDLRGYGDSSKPPDGENHEGYSKRAMAQDQVEVMSQLGFTRFALVGHDRGGRVGHRMALDHPEAVEKLAVLDIVPTHKLYSDVSKAFATVYYHWFFFIQPAPFPETLMGNNAEFVLKSFFSWTIPGAIDDVAFSEYLRCFSDPATLHAMTEDYRAGASIDLDHDDADLQRKVQCPLLALWGKDGAMEKLYDVLETWRERCSDVRGQGLPGGHFFPEDYPQELLEAVRPFLAS